MLPRVAVAAADGTILGSLRDGEGVGPPRMFVSSKGTFHETGYKHKALGNADAGRQLGRVVQWLCQVDERSGKACCQW